MSNMKKDCLKICVNDITPCFESTEDSDVCTPTGHRVDEKCFFPKAKVGSSQTARVAWADLCSDEDDVESGCDEDTCDSEEAKNDFETNEPAKDDESIAEISVQVDCQVSASVRRVSEHVRRSTSKLIPPTPPGSWSTKNEGEKASATHRRLPSQLCQGPQQNAVPAQQLLSTGSPTQQVFLVAVVNMVNGTVPQVVSMPPQRFPEALPGQACYATLPVPPPPPHPPTVPSERKPSRGSIGHPRFCAAPCKYFAKPRGCKDGESCDHCHLCDKRSCNQRKHQGSSNNKRY